MGMSIPGLTFTGREVLLSELEMVTTFKESINDILVAQGRILKYTWGFRKLYWKNNLRSHSHHSPPRVSRTSKGRWEVKKKKKEISDNTITKDTDEENKESVSKETNVVA